MAADLFVPLPVSELGAERGILVQELSQRLREAGYRLAAFAHTVYGKPKHPIDRVGAALSNESLLLQQNGNSACAPELKVLKRLHAVVENLSDAGCFIKQSANAEEAQLLEEYDIVSIAPRNEAVFRSVIASATSCDIITLDYYTVQKSGLPFRVRPADIRTIVERGLVLEIPYAPAVLQSSWRRSWIQTCAEIQQAGRGQKLAVLLSSSGERKAENVKDATAMAIRMPKDLQNLTSTILGFSSTPLGVVANYVVSCAKKRRYGSNLIESIDSGKAVNEKVSVGGSHYDTRAEITGTYRDTGANAVVSGTTCAHRDGSDESQADDDGDGFIAL